MTASTRVRHAGHVIGRNVMVYRRAWMIPVSGFFEPVFYLAAMVVGVGRLVGDLPGPDGRPISYLAFVAPGLLAAAAMNGSLSESTFQLYRKVIDGASYRSMLATPIGVDDVAAGELGWAMVRGGAYAAGFVVMSAVLGAIGSWWAVLALPAALLVCAAFAALGQVITAYAKTWSDLDVVGFVMMPMFLCATTFFPLDVYPRWAQLATQALPLYHGVTLVRALTTGVVGPGMLVHVAYLATMAAVLLAVSTRQLRRRLLD